MDVLEGHGSTTLLLQCTMVRLVTVVITGECDRFSVKNDHAVFVSSVRSEYMELL